MSDPILTPPKQHPVVTLCALGVAIFAMYGWQQADKRAFNAVAISGNGQVTQKIVNAVTAIDKAVGALNQGFGTLNQRLAILEKSPPVTLLSPPAALTSTNPQPATTNEPPK